MSKRKPFQFKQFSVEDSNCGMKVGVDSVLLGAWTFHEKPLRILDIGAGCGVISLMMAQKFPNAEIHAIEIEKDAIGICQENFERSPFSNKFQIHQGDFLEFSSDKKFDLIISNPPYYTGEEAPNNPKRNLARQAHYLPLEKLIQHASSLLSAEGTIAISYPSKELKTLKINNLTILSKLLIKGTKHSEAKRTLIQLGFHKDVTKEEEIIIEHERGMYTNEYIALTKDFYLKF